MRVLHVISSGGMYGAEAVILQLSQALNASEAHQSMLGVFAHKGHPEPALHHAAGRWEVSSQMLACRGQLDMGVASALRALVEQSRINVVHAHGYKADLYTAAAFLGRERPVLVSTCHNWIDSDIAVQLYGALDRLVLRSFDEVVAVSGAVRQRLTESGVPPERVHLIRNGVRLAPESSPRLCSEGDHHVLRIGFVGRLSLEKGADVFLQATQELLRTLPGVEGIIVGDGPERERLEALRDHLGLRGKVSFLGRQEDMASVYQSLDLLVSSSRTEGLPMTLLEGMSWGLPTVATRVGEVPAVVVNGETGLLVEPEAPPALAEAMAALLRDAPLRRQFGEAARQRLQTEFSAERMAQDYVRIYERALRRRQSTPVLSRQRPRTAG